MHERNFSLTILGVALAIALISGCKTSEPTRIVEVAPTSPIPTPTVAVATAVPTATVAESPPPTATRTLTQAPSLTPPSRPTVTVPQASPTPTPITCNDLATFVSDVTIPDGMPIAAGTTFIKTWRIRNIGTCTWTTDYAIVFEHGDQLGDLAAVPLPKEVPPDQAVAISASLTAPTEPGTYKSYWKMRNSADVVFGTGPDKDKDFWVEIVVPAMDMATPTAAQ